MRINFIIILAILFMVSPAAAYKVGPPAAVNNLDEDVRQAVYVVSAEPGSVSARIDLWQRDLDNKWIFVNIYPIPAVLGRNGMAPQGEKKEGDGRTPSGIFQLRRSFGYEKQINTGLEYTQVTEKDFWIDEPSSPDYNQWVTGEPPLVSREVLRREDDLYKYAAVIEYNTDPVVEGNGSAIFLHVWRAEGKPTAGCAAVPEQNMIEILEWLDVKMNPVIILYDAGTSFEAL